MSVEAAFASALDRAQSSHSFDALVVAVSGGGDSMALLHLAAAWGAQAHVSVAAVTVDHGLRAAAAQEAEMVARSCQAIGVEHKTLEWRGWDGQGNLQSMARAARYDLIADWAAPGAVVLLGHTKDDAAETFLMRLARGSGVDGLAAMRVDWQDRGLRWLRPLIDLRRAKLRDWLVERGIAWAEDPSNDDPTYTRVQMRQAMSMLAPLGLDVDRLVDTADAMARARAGLAHWAHVAAMEAARIEAGDVVFDAAQFAVFPEETRFRLLAQALMWVASATYRPRLSAIMDLDRLILGPGKMTLAGCLVSRKADHIRVARELNAVSGVITDLGSTWDTRWQIRGPEGVPTTGFRLAALGETGLAACPDWRETGLPRDSLLATPAVWRGPALIAAPLAGFANGWTANLTPPMGDFIPSLLSH